MREKLRRLQQELLEQLEIALDGDMEVADALEESNDALSRAIEALPAPRQMRNTMNDGIELDDE